MKLNFLIGLLNYRNVSIKNNDEMINEWWNDKWMIYYPKPFALILMIR